MRTPDAPLKGNAACHFVLVPVVAILVGAWSLGLSAFIRKEFDPAIPQWAIVGTAGLAIVGVSYVIGRSMQTRIGLRIAMITVGCMLVPMVATVFGGIYWWAANRFSPVRTSWATVILGAGLGITTFGFGIATSMEVPHMIYVFLGSLAGLALLRNAEPQPHDSFLRFGALHFLTFIAAMAVASMEDQQRRSISVEQLPSLESQNPLNHPLKP